MQPTDDPTWSSTSTAETAWPTANVLVGYNTLLETDRTEMVNLLRNISFSANVQFAGALSALFKTLTAGELNLEDSQEHMP